MKRYFLAPELCIPMLSAITEVDEGRRADANEATLFANALTADSIKVLGTIYPGNVARQVANVNPQIDPADEEYTYYRLDEVGMADYVANYGDDIPMVEQYAMPMSGRVKHLATGFQYSTQDIRRITAARRRGRMPSTIDVNKLALANRVMERKKDDIFALGDTVRNLPGMLTNPNVTQIDAAASAEGGFTRSWTGGDKTPEEILIDLTNGVDTVVNQSKESFKPNALILPTNRKRKLSSTPMGSGDTRTILEAFQESNVSSDIGELRIFSWEKAGIADSGNPRAMLGYFSDETLQLIDPLGLTPQSPQPNNLAWKVPCEGRCGGTVIYQPLAFVYIDQI